MRTQYKEYAQWIRLFNNSEKGAEAINAYKERIGKSLQMDDANPLVSAPYRAKQGLKKNYHGELERELKAILHTQDLSGYQHAFGVLVNLFLIPMAQYTAYVELPVLTRLKDLAINARSSLYMTLISSFAILTARLEQKRNVRMLIPNSTRVLEEFENIIGWMTSEVVVCIDLQEHLSVKEFIASVTDVVVEASRYQFYPHERVLQDLDIPLHILAPHFLNCIASDEEIKDFTPHHSPNGSGHFDLKCTMMEHKNGISIVTDYNKEIYEAGQIEALIRDYFTILDNMLASPDKPIINLM
jgi:hypothetical protein